MAAFVAATIESRVVADLKEENDQLRAEIDKTRAAALQSARRGGCVEITGQGGSPVYAYGMLHKATSNGYAGEQIFCDIDLVDTGEKCQISKALDAEIRINGIKVAKVGECDWEATNASVGETYESNIHVFDGERGMHWDSFTVLMSYGPFPPLGRWAREPRDMRDEDVEEVRFDTLSVTILKTDLAGDVLGVVGSAHHFP